MTGEGTVGPKIDERIALRMGWSIAASGFLVQMATNRRYGYFRDELYWEEMVRKVAEVYNALPPEERAKTAILGGNYGGAGAIDFFGKKYGLPKSISAHQNYYYWGYCGFDGETMIMLERSRENAEKVCDRVDDGPLNAPEYGMRWEHFTILTCHHVKRPMEQAWERWKVWN